MWNLKRCLLQQSKFGSHYPLWHMFLVSSCWRRKDVKKSSIHSAHIFPMCVCVCLCPPVVAQKSGGDQLSPAAAAVSGYTESQPVTASVPGLLTLPSLMFVKTTLKNSDDWCICGTAEVQCKHEACQHWWTQWGLVFVSFNWFTLF